MAAPLPRLNDHLVHGGAAVAVGAARFVPIPLLDDWLASMSRRQLAKSILRRHGRRFAVGDVHALYDDGWWAGLPFRMLKNVVLFPVRKILRPLLPFLLARDLGLAVGRTLALGHTLDRQLRLGLLRDDDDRAGRRDDAQRLRKALDTAWQGIDQRVVKNAVSGLSRLVKKNDEAPPPEYASFLEELDRRVDQALAGIEAR